MKMTLFLGLTILLGFIDPTLSFAKDGHHESGPGELVFPLINFVTYLVLLFLVARKPLAQMMETRHHTVVNALNKASEVVALATADLKEAQKLLANVDSECARITAEIGRDGETEARQILDDANARAARVVEQAKKNAEAERKATLESIRREIAESVLQKAEARLKSEIGNDQDRSLRSGVISGVGALH